MEMKKHTGGRNRAGIIGFACLILFFAMLLFFTSPGEVQAAKRQSISVKIDNQFWGTLTKKKGSWMLSVGQDFHTQEGTSVRGVHYVKFPRGKGFTTGYYYFKRNGVLNTKKAFRKLNTTVNNVKFYGEYYFGGKNGRLRTKAGWVQVSGKKYYITASGRKFTNGWKKGYYLLKNGQIARNTKTPDGFYVDETGRKCSKADWNLRELKKSLENMTAGYSGTWSVYLKNLETGGEILINDKSMRPASVIKLFVMASTYDQIYKGNIKKTSYVSGLLSSMITVSDNEAYNALVRLNGGGSFSGGCDVINRYLKKNGFDHTECHYSLHPSSTPLSTDGKGSNKVGAEDAGRLLEQIYDGTCVSAKYSGEMKELLLRQTRRAKIPSGIPSGIKVGNKTGETSTEQNDVAIVYGKKN